MLSESVSKCSINGAGDVAFKRKMFMEKWYFI